MKTIKPLLVTVVIASLFTACATKGNSPTQLASNMINRESVTHLTHDNYPAKSPQTVSLFTPKQSPHAAYRVIGVAKVSKYNLLGKERNQETVNTMMQKLAASIGGDGLIDMDQNENTVEAKVIAYQKILI